jgi:hypothetical protein
MRGGDLDDPDTKEYLNSKIADLEQKITELKAEIPVQIGFRNEIGPDRQIPFAIPLWVKTNISVNDFWKYVGKRLLDHVANAGSVTLFLSAVYSLPSVRGLRINECSISFMTDNKEENTELRERNLEALNAKYPGLFVL